MFNEFIDFKADISKGPTLESPVFLKPVISVTFFYLSVILISLSCPQHTKPSSFFRNCLLRQDVAGIFVWCGEAESFVDRSTNTSQCPVNWSSRFTMYHNTYEDKSKYRRTVIQNAHLATRKSNHSEWHGCVSK